MEKPITHEMIEVAERVTTRLTEPCAICNPLSETCQICRACCTRLAREAIFVKTNIKLPHA